MHAISRAARAAPKWTGPKLSKVSVARWFSSDTEYQRAQTPVLSTPIVHELDSAVEFAPKSHQYKYVQNPQLKLDSVTKLISTLSEPFNPTVVINNIMNSVRYETDPTYKYYKMDPRDIRKSWRDISAWGTSMHNAIERIQNGYYELSYENSRPLTKDVTQYKQFERDLYHETQWNGVRSEMRLVAPDLRLAGTCDALFRYQEGNKTRYALCDWKFVEAIDDQGFKGKTLKPPVDDLLDSRLNKYALQVYSYKAILEQYYNMDIGKVYLVQFNNAQSSYTSHDLPDLTEHVERLFQMRRQN